MPVRILSFLLLFVVSSCLLGKTDTASAAMPGIRATLLTCSPGPDLYSVFGHTAIRLQFVNRGVPVDKVYNYGTFEFDEDFYAKFTRGKLDYMLSRADFANFMAEYEQSGRGVVEQDLNLTASEAAALLERLENNLLPENRYYRYDFFYDNCATRVRDMIAATCAQSGADVVFTHVPKDNYTFRQAIQRYLDYMPWSDLGIDIALGTPCDRVMQPGQDMFLPDSLYMEFRFALREGTELGSTERTLLPQRFFPSRAGWLQPVNLFFLFLLIQVIWGIYALNRTRNDVERQRQMTIPDRILLAVCGLVGVLVVFLWFFPDHTATRPNYNLLWAHPLLLVLACASGRARWHRSLSGLQLSLAFILLMGFFLFDQRLHWATIPLVIGQVFICLKMLRPSWFKGEKAPSVVLHAHDR